MSAPASPSPYGKGGVWSLAMFAAASLLVVLIMLSGNLRMLNRSHDAFGNGNSQSSSSRSSGGSSSSLDSLVARFRGKYSIKSESIMSNIKVKSYLSGSALEGEFNASDTESDLTSRRRLSTDFNYFTGESQATFNGRVPKTTCPPGSYRPQGSTDMIMVSGQQDDGCAPCPVGRYGSVAGLTSPLCSNACPAGTFSDRVGIVSALDCQACPVGKYGTYAGLTTRDCTASCPAGKYTSTTGNVYKSDCKVCPTGFRSWQCTWAVAPRIGQIQDHLEGGPFGLKPKQQDPLPQ